MITRRATGVKKKGLGPEGTALAEAKKALRHLDVTPVKGLGQHFLIDTAVLESIITAAELEASDTVIEVGPGLGTLTGALATRAGKVIAVEIDSRLASALMGAFSRLHHVEIVNADILDQAPRSIVKAHATNSSRLTAYKVVANLPYNVAAPVLRHFLEAELKPVLMVIMVQKEVAQEITAEIGDMSLLSISVQIYGKPVIIEYVPPSSFYPRPKVDSAIVRIDVYPEPAIELDDISGFFEVVKGGFSTRRKQLRNALSIGLRLKPLEAARLLNDAGIDPQRRPQTLSIQEWAQLYHTFIRM